MKKMIKKGCLFFLMVISNLILGQSPSKMSYQAIIRNNSNALVVSAPVGLRISVLQGSSNGTAVFVETHTMNTNSNGLVSFKIGDGTNLTGSLSSINWGNGPYFIKTEVDPSDGTNYSVSGASELLSVPYALYSEKGNVGPTGATGPVGTVGSTGPAGIPPAGTITGQMLIWDGVSSWIPVNPNSSNMVLTSGTNNKPTWTYEGKAISSLPTVLTVSASIHFGNPRFTGDVTNGGNLNVISRGFCWSQTESNPTITNVPASQIRSECGGTGSYFSNQIPYSGTGPIYYRAFAINANGVSYGNVLIYTP